jgi:hypothetical protein
VLGSWSDLWPQHIMAGGAGFNPYSKPTPMATPPEPPADLDDGHGAFDDPGDHATRWQSDHHPVPQRRATPGRHDSQYRRRSARQVSNGGPGSAHTNLAFVWADVTKVLHDLERAALRPGNTMFIRTLCWPGTLVNVPAAHGFPSTDVAAHA